jgi:putative oxidoreductase
MTIQSTLDAYRPHAIGILRVVAALLYMAHGTQKGPDSLSPLMLISAILEVGGGLLLLLGAFTRPVAFILSGHMAVAYFIAHFPKSFYPVANGGDAAILFCFVFLMFVTTGAGSFAFDNRRSGN